MDDKPKKTWYELNKEQIKLIQWLLYHLKKNKNVSSEQKGIIVKENGDFTLEFK